MILMWVTSISRANGRGGGGPENRDFFWALKWPRAKRVPFGPKKVETLSRLNRWKGGS
jgi:hypothetical protein